MAMHAKAASVAEPVRNKAAELRSVARQPILDLHSRVHGYELLFWNGLGGFRPDGREYLIVLDEHTVTPAPWCNVLANSEAGCIWSGRSGQSRL